MSIDDSLHLGPGLAPRGDGSVPPARRDGEQGLVVVSNRLPVRHCDEGWVPSPGGLVAVLDPVLARTAGSAWVGWAGGTSPGGAETVPPPPDHAGIALHPVNLSTDEVAGYYDGLSNATLWPLYHHGVRPPVLDRDDWWERYVAVNDRMAAAAAAVAPFGGTVWVHDYHLQLVPAALRRRRRDLRIGFFLHIPFPPPELFQRLPWRDRLVAGVLGADLVGFQTEADAANFQVAAVATGVLRPDGDHHLVAGARRIEVRAFPISVDARRCELTAARPEVRDAAAAMRRELGDPEIVFLGVDRLDYTKGIVERLVAFDRVLAHRPELAERSVLVQVASPSRVHVPAYDDLRTEVERLVGRINGEWGRIGRPVVHYLHRELPFEEVVGAYLAADVLVVTPLADGMNLVAKEFAVARAGEPATLVISEFTGAVDELGDAAVVVNAFDPESIATGLLRAVDLTPEERCRRTRRMADTVRRRNVHFWSRSFLGALRSSAMRPVLN